MTAQELITPRERTLQAIVHQKPDRLPVTLYLGKEVKEKLLGALGPRENWPCPEDDTVRILWPVDYNGVRDGYCTDMFGCDWSVSHDGFMMGKPLLDEPAAERIPVIDLVPRQEVDRILKIRNDNPDKFIFYQFSLTFGERLWSLRGLQETCMDYLLEPVFVETALDMLMEMHMKALDTVLELPIDGVTFGDDFGSQRGLMISRDVILRYYKPRYAKLYEKVRSAGKVVGTHSCGDNTDIMGDYVDIGLQVFHPLQPECMDIKKIKAEFGKDLAFRGGIGTQGAIASGTPQQAREEVRQAVEILSEGGGYLLETTKPLPAETPLENAIAVMEEMAKCSHYDFG